MAVLKYYVFGQDKSTLLLGIFLPIWIIMLIAWRNNFVEKNSFAMLWRVMHFVPLILCLVHYYFHNYKGYYGHFIGSQLPLYIVSFYVLILFVIRHANTGYKVLALVGVVFAIAMFLVSTIYTALSFTVMGNFTRTGYEECFDGIVSEMKENYCLNEWKDIDYEYLTEKVKPKVIRAENDKDEKAFFEALCEYCYYIYDGHVYVRPANVRGQAIFDEAKDDFAGNDYGFSMFTVSTGETVVVDIDDDCEARKLGLHEGTIITKWNGKNIDEASAEVNCIYPYISYPIKENEDMIRSIFLAGRGKEEITVTYIDDSGVEKEATVKTIGPYTTRLERVLCRFYSIDKLGDKYIWDSAIGQKRSNNFECKMLNDEFGYLRINREHYQNVDDIRAIFRGNYPELTRDLKKKLNGLKKQGMKKLIIDTRNNSGGYDDISGAVAALFTDEDIYTYSFGEYKDDEYVKYNTHYAKADGSFKDMEVIVLTNSRCCSAGDSLVYFLSKCPNVTVMGMTMSNGINQNIGGACVTTNGDFMITYPIQMTIDENDTPLIDTRSSRKSRVGVDEKIPITIDDIDDIFGDNDIDFELEYIINRK